MTRLFVSLALFVLTLPIFAATVPAPRDVDITAPDGIKLKATFYAAAKPGPGVLLLHMCNSNRKAWEPVASQLRADGINALTLDYRGYGDSEGERIDFRKDPQKLQQMQTTKWPGDIDAAYAWLLAQPGVDKGRIGAGGGSCGVDQAVQVARRHSEVKSLVLLAGGTNRAGLDFLSGNPWLPLFTAAAADDEFDSQAPQNMQWLSELNGNPSNQFVGFQDGKHGTEIFGPHPELPREIVAWYVKTLLKAPANPKTRVAVKKTPAWEFWSLLNEPGGVPKAAQFFHQTRQRDPHAYLFPEFVVNAMAYERMQAKQTKEAVQLCQLNAEAYPNSSNVYDSLGDAYLADGQNDKAIEASRKALELLPGDKNVPEPFKKVVQQSAEGKLQKLKAEPTQ
ncbi:MAG TPA: dienelactone hydrolase family protein [Terriglobales bacterium]|nr:dienelactone hydrolase family protein [Terriglobales bacterium]